MLVFPHALRSTGFYYWDKVGDGDSCDGPNLKLMKWRKSQHYQ